MKKISLDKAARIKADITGNMTQAAIAQEVQDQSLYRQRHCHRPHSQGGSLAKWRTCSQEIRRTAEENCRT